MGRPKWVSEKQMSDIKDSFELIKSKSTRSVTDFRVPSTLKDDFKHLLEHDVPNTNYTFELVHDWYERKRPGYKPLMIRAQQTPIDWKSKIGNSDMSVNFKVDLDTHIQKGDIAIREDGMLYMLHWNVTCHPNNFASQSIELNDVLTFTRDHRLHVDEYGFMVDEEYEVELDEYGREVICRDMPCSHSAYNGRPEFSIAQAQPGIVANNIVNMYIQYNSQTDRIQINDQTRIGGFIYTVHEVYKGQVDINKDYGTIYIQMRRLPGGDEHE